MSKEDKMNTRSSDALRECVDALRVDTMSQPALEQRLRGDMTAVLASRGIVGGDLTASARREHEVLHDAGSGHLCPWDTCQATRHG
jgi:hypothetical protein